MYMLLLGSLQFWFISMLLTFYSRLQETALDECVGWTPKM